MNGNLCLSSVAELCELLKIFQQLFVQHHCFKSNVSRGIRLLPFLFPGLSIGQSWMGAFMKVGVAMPFVHLCTTEMPLPASLFVVWFLK